MDAIIEAKGLVKRWGEVTALDGLDLIVDRGSVLALLGPNGAGKTTAISILTTLQVADGGRATVAGADVTGDPGRVRERIGPISWVMAWVGLVVPGPEVVSNAAMMVIFPLTFVADTFVPAANLPGVLRVFAQWNPVSAVTHASRELFGNIPAGVPEPTGGPSRTPRSTRCGSQPAGLPRRPCPPESVAARFAPLTLFAR